MPQVAVQVSGFGRRLLFGGGLGNKILAAWTQITWNIMNRRVTGRLSRPEGRHSVVSPRL